VFYVDEVAIHLNPKVARRLTLPSIAHALAGSAASGTPVSRLPAEALLQWPSCLRRPRPGGALHRDLSAGTLQGGVPTTPE